MEKAESGSDCLRIVICEDEGMVVMQLRNALRRAGHEVIGEAVEGTAGIELARSLKPDLILMDINMPGMNGLDATRTILSEQAIPIVMLTAYGDDKSVQDAMDAGACAYLVKPITKDQLLPAVKTAVAQYSTLQKTQREKSTLKSALKQSMERQTTASTQATKAALRQNLPPAATEPIQQIQQTGISDRESTEQELLALTHRLLEAIHAGDVETYRALSLPELTCYETDVAPYRIEGVDFHVDLMNAMKAQGGFANLTRFDMLTPHVQIYADTAIVTYTRLMTYAGVVPPLFRSFNETRVYVRQQGASGHWRMAHFHRSQAAG